MEPTEVRTDAKEYKIPLALLTAGFLIQVVHAVYFSRDTGVAVAFIAMGMVLAIQVTLGLIACLIAGRIADADYGALGPGCLKLAAIFVFTGAVAACLQAVCMSSVVSLGVTWVLFQWLFGLDPFETWITVLVIWAVNVGTLFVVTLASLRMHG
jgi:hypothetical protein